MIVGLPPLLDLAVDSILARGLANQERIVLRAHTDLYTTNIGLMLGYRHPDGSLVPIRDRMFWLGSGQVKAGSIINVYTGAGEMMSFDNGNNTKTYNLFWGLDYVAFDVPQVEAILFRVGQATIGPVPLPRLSIAGPQQTQDQTTL